MYAAVYALWKREIIKFVRDRSRVIGAVAQPFGFWLLLGLGFQGTFHLPGAETGYMTFLFPGVLAMVLLFTALFSTISIVEERKAGFLQAALVAPVPRLSLVFGATLGGTTLALVQALLFLVLLPFVSLSPTPVGLLLLTLGCFLTGLSFTALGVLLAWRMETTRGFHAVMNIVLIPMWLLSGAVFPLTSAPAVLRWVMMVNPVTYGITLIRQALYWPAPAPDSLVTVGPALGISAAFALLLLLLAVHAVRKPLYGG